jgi:hypothetical protein
MKKFIFLIISLFVVIFMNVSRGICQTISNGSFDGTATGWSNCGLTLGPEVKYTEQAYGSTATCGGGGSCNQTYDNCGTGCAGNPSPNYVAEVDIGDSPGLCQNVTLPSGSHTLSLDLARRTNTLASGKGAPATTSIQVCFIDPGNAANFICQTFTRSSTTFTFSTSTWTFNTSSFPFGLPSGGNVTLQITNNSTYDSGGGGADSDNYGMIVGSVSFGTTPITLLDFKAVENGLEVDINWQTATEINNDYFTIEKSKNGIGFTAVAIVDGAGNSQSTLNYQTTDPSPYNGVSYYRLKQTDLDGTVSYSKIIAVNSNADENISIHPNPGTGIFKIQGLGTGSEITVHNPLGQIILIKRTFSDSSEIDLSSQPSGVYYVKINNGYTSIISKIILNK